MKRGALLVVTLASLAHAQAVPQALHYRAYLTDNNIPLSASDLASVDVFVGNTTWHLTLTSFDGGDPSVTMQDGILDLNLATDSTGQDLSQSLASTGGSATLIVNVTLQSSVVLALRQQVVSVPFARYASQLAPLAQIDGGIVSPAVAGSLQISGGLAVGGDGGMTIDSSGTVTAGTVPASRVFTSSLRCLAGSVTGGDHPFTSAECGNVTLPPDIRSCWNVLGGTYCSGSASLGWASCGRCSNGSSNGPCTTTAAPASGGTCQVTCYFLCPAP